MRKTTRWLFIMLALVWLADILLDAQREGKSFSVTILTASGPVLFISIIFVMYFLAARKKAESVIPPDLLAKQRICVNRHNTRVYGLFILLLPGFALAIYAMHIKNTAGFWSLIAVVFSGICAGMAVIKRADVKLCYKINFLCPFCGKPLYYASGSYDWSSLVTRGECPRCQRLIAERSENVESVGNQ